MRSARTFLLLGVVGVLLMVWTLIPIYHMLAMALTPAAETFAGSPWPNHPTLKNFVTVLTQGHFFLRNFWQQLFNSVLVAVSVTLIVLFIASITSFAISRLRVPGSRLVSHTALLTYVIPAAFLTIPMYRIMVEYTLVNTRLALVLVIVTFATPYAIWVLKQSADTIPEELEEAARIDGASLFQLFWLIYIPLLAPSLVAIGTYSLLLAWNEYLYALILLSSEDRLTVPIALGRFLASDDAPWNLLMASGIIYSLPPVAIYFAFRRHLADGLLSGAVKG